ncbi:isopeptide-forming domain-containing fimbrial protein [Anaerosphaera multitolerans]|uniref:DUF11 domain-containing protein n=1 Tax=Anaerosphaera multitolerans TaxID=2487351 RepID=A0A437S4T6_9FIRM|nr:isopeptide-forming domain-containing fimbrial protein [Anaerosphaera multitolerans]RVU54010.1 DUF11 domain-containing protein [Anaerosphaera multitolerans]
MASKMKNFQRKMALLLALIFVLATPLEALAQTVNNGQVLANEVVEVELPEEGSEEEILEDVLVEEFPQEEIVEELLEEEEAQVDLSVNSDREAISNGEEILITSEIINSSNAVAKNVVYEFEVPEGFELTGTNHEEILEKVNNVFQDPFLENININNTFQQYMNFEDGSDERNIYRILFGDINPEERINIETTLKAGSVEESKTVEFKSVIKGDNFYEVEGFCEFEVKAIETNDFTDITAPGTKVFKINKDSNQEIDITEEVHYYLESQQQQLNTRARFSRAVPSAPAVNDPNFPLYVDFVIKVNYKKADGSAYEMSDYITDPITINLKATYVGDSPQGGGVVSKDVTDKLTPKNIQIGLNDVYGNGGEKDKDLFVEDVVIDGFTNIGDYLSTNFYATVDSSVFKTTPDGQSLDAYITLSERTGGNEAVPEMIITFIENPQPDGTLGTAKIKKKVLNETKNESQYADSTVADLGDIVSYKIEIENKANTVNEVTFEDVLDKNLTDIELVKGGLAADDVIEYDETTNTISGSASVQSKGIKTFIYKAKVGRDAYGDIRNTVVMTRLAEYKGIISMQEEDKILLADDGDIIEITDVNGVTTEIIIKGDKGFIQTIEEDFSDVKVNLGIGVFNTTKTVDKVTVNPEDTVTFTVRAKNEGATNTLIKGAVVTDDVPAIFEDVRGTAKLVKAGQASGEGTNIAVVKNGNKLTTTAVDLVGGEEIILTITAKVKKDAKIGPYTNIAVVTGVGPDGKPLDPDEGKVDGNVAEPGHTKVASADKVKPGESFFYIITIKNTSSEIKENILVEDKVPAGLTIINTEPTATVSGQNIKYTVASLAPGAETILKINVKVNDDVEVGTIFENVAVIDGKEVPDEEKPEVVPGIGEFKTTKTVDKVNVNPGDSVTFTVKAKNNGKPNTLIKNVIVTDDVPAVFEDVRGTAKLIKDGQDSVLGTNIPVTKNGNKLTTTAVDLVGGEEIILTITAKVKKDAVIGQYTNIAVSTGTDPEGEPLDPDEGKVDGNVTDPGHTKVASTDKVKPGETFFYTITIKNTTSELKEDIVVEDSVPTGLTIIKTEPTATVSGQNIKYTVARLAAGAETTLKVTVKVNDNVEAGTVFENVAVVGGKEVPDEEKPQVVPVPSFKTKKEAYLNGQKLGENSTVTPGAELKYVIKIENTGNVELKNVQIEDKLNKSVEYIQNSISAPVGSTIVERDGVISGTIASIKIGETVEISFKVTVKVAGLTEDANAKNVAAVSPEEVENPTDPENPKVPVEPQYPETPELPIDQISSSEKTKKAYLISDESEEELIGQMIRPGSLVKYVVKIKNTGNIPMTNINFEDEINENVIIKDYNSDDGTVLTNDNGVIKGVINSIAPNNTVTITINVQVKTEAEGIQFGANVKNSAKVDDEIVPTPDIPVAMVKFNVPNKKIYKEKGYEGLPVEVTATFGKGRYIPEMKYVLIPLDIQNSNIYKYLNSEISERDFDVLYTQADKSLKGLVDREVLDGVVKGLVDVEDNYILLVKSTTVFNNKSEVAIGSAYIDNFYTPISIKHKGIGDASNLATHGGEEGQLVYDFTDENVEKINNDNLVPIGFPLDAKGKVIDRIPDGTSGIKAGEPTFGYDEVKITSYHKDKFSSVGWDLVLSNPSNEYEVYSTKLDGKYNTENNEVVVEKSLKYIFDYIGNKNLLSIGEAEIIYMQGTVKDKFFANVEFRNADENSTNKKGKVYIFKKGVVEEGKTNPNEVFNSSKILGVFDTDVNGKISTQDNDVLAALLVKEYGGDLQGNKLLRVPVQGSDKVDKPIYAVFQEDGKLLSDIFFDKVKSSEVDEYTELDVTATYVTRVRLVTEEGAKINIYNNSTNELVSDLNVIGTGKAQMVYFNKTMKSGDTIRITTQKEGKRASIDIRTID